MVASTVHPINSVPVAHLGRLFDEESHTWARDLNWNFEPTRRRLEAALHEGTLNGVASSDEEGVSAYATYAIDGNHGMVGSFFASGRSKDCGLEAILVREVLDRLLAHGRLVIDCQTLFSSDRGLREPFASRGFDSASRIYMTLDRATWLGQRKSTFAGKRSQPTERRHLRSVARLVYEAHQETRDLDASSSFDTLESCEGILRQIILDEVCGPFDPKGSRRLETDGQAVAVSLLTWPLPGVAHISEVASAPSHRRLGLARECLGESLESAFMTGGASCATLSVTASNQAAVALYESMGFTPRVRYESHVLRDRPCC